MSDTRVPRTLFFAILAAGILQCLHDFPFLPDRLASHFSAAGHANGWMTKQQFLMTYAVVILPAVALEFLMPRRIAGTPGNRLRLPNREFWLAPERRAETFAYFQKFFAFPTGPIVFAIAAFVLFNIVWVAAMVRRFSKLPQG